MHPVFGVLFDGLAYGMLLFLMSVGLSVTLGMMNFVNLAHCSFAMLGGYVAITLMNAFGWPFLATLPAAFVAAAAASVVLERIFFRRFYRASDLEQCLLTIGIVFVSIAIAAYIYGTDQQPMQPPVYLRGSINFFGLDLAVYRLFLIAVALVITAALMVTVETTRFGAQVRAAVSVVLERVFFRRFYRASDLEQCLLTIGIVFISIAAAAYIYGTTNQPVQLPDYLHRSIDVAGLNLAVYRIILIAIALAITALLVITIEKTRFGAQVRAAVNNQRMARGLGINVDALFAITFALGSGLAGLGGALAIEIIGLDPSFALTYLIYVLIVVSVGGLGSIFGSFAAAMVLGIADVAGKYYVPAFGAFLIYLVMIVLLMWRPTGLFGRR